ncbi:MAG: hypothetical protein LZ172_01020 [Thaumarchaeota archaeon]|jgi:hypothetical protein|nr:hypothetical protein [Candidatus Geocrenenecus arthurdayi]MCL7390778.1 hypothetical protein [Candidatus Geocrenenecus arthurdayi]MCL7402918.1 hypothetical protein [Candidatus Geocrenenecus arthurdayi]
MERVRISSWIDAKSIAEGEVEKRLRGKIKDSWVESIWLTPYSEGSKWIVKLKVVLTRGLFEKKSYYVFMKINSITGEVEEFKASEPSK